MFSTSYSVLCVLVICLASISAFRDVDTVRRGVHIGIESLVYRWAPLVFLAPEEKFFPGDVAEFLQHVIPIPLVDSAMYEAAASGLILANPDDLPKGRQSEGWYLTTKENVDNLLKNESSFLYGRNPQAFPIPVYALVTNCHDTCQRHGMWRVANDNNTLDNNILTMTAKKPNFHVTYWMFYPFNQGKSMCTVDMGRFGAWPIPKVNNHCLGDMKEFGNHVGDWEHMSLYFEGSATPKKLYVSTHDVGAYYRYSDEHRRFEYERKEVRKGILQRPVFPPVLKLSKPGGHPVIYAAKGSHGVWTAPGRHRFVRLPRLHDYSGFGVPWQTWKSIRLLKPHSYTDRNWLRYKGRWGNPKNKCHPVSKLGLNICEVSEGPTGIPLKKTPFQCRSCVNL